MKPVTEQQLIGSIKEVFGTRSGTKLLDLLKELYVHTPKGCNEVNQMYYDSGQQDLVLMFNHYLKTPMSELEVKIVNDDDVFN